MWVAKVLSVSTSREFGLLYTLRVVGTGELFKHRQISVNDCIRSGAISIVFPST